MESQRNRLSKEELSTQQVFVLDASAVYNGIHVFNLEGVKFVPECVLEEVRGMFRGAAFIEEALLYDELKIAIPETSTMMKIKKAAKETGDLQELSECDLAVLCLGAQLQSQNKHVTILTDDYDIQNLAKHLGISYCGIHWKGITHKRIYLWVCLGCGYKSRTSLKDCPECGSEMKREYQQRKIRRQK